MENPSETLKMSDMENAVLPERREQSSRPLIKFTIITLFQEALRPYLDSSMLFKAQKNGIIEIEYVNLRDFGLGPHKSVDDTPYGGGDGMLLRVEPVFAAVESVKQHSPAAEVILPTPVGAVWDESLARQFAGMDKELDNIAERVREISLRKKPTDETKSSTESAKSTGQNKSVGETKPANDAKSISESALMSETKLVGETRPMNETKHFIIICPHYEGYDERIMRLVDYPISLGNYVLTGGELAALIIIDSVSRLLPGVLGGASSALAESFADDECRNLEYPQYTKPAEFRGDKVPEVLLSGNHGEIAKWRASHSRKTRAR